MRRWLVVIDDPEAEFELPEELEDMLKALTFGHLGRTAIVRVQRGGLLATKVMAELPPVRHRDMGRARG